MSHKEIINSNEIKVNLQRIRLEKGLTQKQLAEQSGIKIRTIQSYECGGRSIDGADLGTLIALASALNVPFYAILDDILLVEKIKENI